MIDTDKIAGAAPKSTSSSMVKLVIANMIRFLCLLYAIVLRIKSRKIESKQVLLIDR